MTSATSVSVPQESSHRDEFFMQQSLLLSDTLKVNYSNLLVAVQVYCQLWFSHLLGNIFKGYKKTMLRLVHQNHAINKDE